MSLNFVERLEAWKARFGVGDTAALERMLQRAARFRPRDADELIRLHETLLFLRAYPRSARAAREADKALAAMHLRVTALLDAGADMAALEEPEVSGIAGTKFSAIFSFEVVRRLLERHGRAIDIDWDAWEDSEQLGAVGSLLIPLLAEDWPVEAHVPFRRWFEAAAGGRGRELAWLMGRLAKLPDGARLYESLGLQLTWKLGNSAASRTRTRLPGGRLFCHTAPLLRRSDIALETEFAGPRLPFARVGPAEARRVLDVILDTSAVRYRELYGFSHPDADHVYRSDAGRGLVIYWFGVPPEWRLPLRAYHGGMFFKNGVPSGYVEVLSLFERAEVGFNLYYTFREGESAWIYAKLLQLCREQLGVTCFSVDPYQIGHENEEAIASGAIWFYRKLGFRPVQPAAAALMEREERRLRAKPGYRSPPAVLRKIAVGPMLYESPGAQAGDWDRFQVRTLGLALTRSGGIEALLRKSLDSGAVGKVLRAKHAAEEVRYLRLLQRLPRLRAAALKLGSSAL
jgi:hypothetical protein